MTYSGMRVAEDGFHTKPKRLLGVTVKAARVATDQSSQARRVQTLLSNVGHLSPPALLVHIFAGSLV